MKETFLVRHLLQIFLMVLLATALAYVPFLVAIPETGQTSVAITVFLVFILAFEINNAITKHRHVRRNINLELSRLRRVHHLAENMSPRRTKWFDAVNKAIKNYLNFFKAHSFDEYTEARTKFREVTHLVYSFAPKNRRQEVLFKELLETTRELAATRQLNTALLNQRISSFQWIILLIVEVLVVASALLTQGAGTVAFFINVSLLSSIFLVTLLIWEVDDYNRNELNQFANLYLENGKNLKKEKGR